jgi:hypothetical protein
VQTIPAQLLLRTELSRGFKPNSKQKVNPNEKSILEQRLTQPLTTMKILQDSTDWPIVSQIIEDSKGVPKENYQKKYPTNCHIPAREEKLQNDIKLLRNKLRKCKKQVMNLRYRSVILHNLSNEISILLSVNYVAIIYSLYLV